jgi:hypothetical protein
LFHCLGQALTQSPAPGHRKTIQCHLQAEKQGKIWIRTCNYASTKNIINYKALKTKNENEKISPEYPKSQE